MADHHGKGADVMKMRTRGRNKHKVLKMKRKQEVGNNKHKVLKMKKPEEGRKQEHGAEACHLRDKGDESGGWDCLEQGCSNPLQISGGGVHVRFCHCWCNWSWPCLHPALCRE